jgi:hypothetical protein
MNISENTEIKSESQEKNERKVYYLKQNVEKYDDIIFLLSYAIDITSPDKKILC